MTAFSQTIDESPPVTRRARPLLGTFVDIRCRHQNGARAIAAAFAEIERIQHFMSFHSFESDVSRLNRSALTEPVRVNPHTYFVLLRSLELFECSAGAFDIAIAPLLERWEYLPRHYGPSLGRSRGTSASIELMDNERVRFRHPLRIDLGGIAKGYAVDRAVTVLQSYGVVQGAVNAGGDLRVFGPASEPIVVRDPRLPQRFLPLPALHEAAIATSASYFAEKRWHRKRVSPLINTQTDKSWPAHRSVTVRAPTCLLADALCKIVGAESARTEAVLAHYAAEAWILTSEYTPHPDV